MLVKMDFAHLSVDGTPMDFWTVLFTNLPGLEFPLLDVTVMFKQTHPMEILELMLPSVLLPMSWRRLSRTQLEVVGVTRELRLVALLLELLRMQTNVLGTSPSPLEQSTTTLRLELATTLFNPTGNWAPKLAQCLRMNFWWTVLFL